MHHQQNGRIMIILGRNNFKMKIILSRKGFDSGSGGVPSPIFPDGKILSLPIPDKSSPIKYKDINCNGISLGEIVSDLTNGKISTNYRVHLDPDLIRQSLPRHHGWRPILGQVKAAQGHLRKQNVSTGDIFLFFGLFRDVVSTNSGLEYHKFTFPKHLLWGWLQIEKIISVDTCDEDIFKWANYHPHFNREKDNTNTIYISKKHLEIPGIKMNTIKGAGVFENFSNKFQLTVRESKKSSLWQLPRWFFPSDNKPPLTYHRDFGRWTKNNNNVFLNTVGRGQEFVFDTKHYPEALLWISNILKSAKPKH